MGKIQLAVFIGGKSPEHAISLRSGQSVISALNKEKYDVHVIGIDPSGHWHYCDPSDYLKNPTDVQNLSLKIGKMQVALDFSRNKCLLTHKNTGKTISQIDAVFPVLHGSNGEDGVIQGIFRSVNVAFVGVDILTSSVGMDKDVAKRLWRDAGIPVADFLTIYTRNKHQVSFQSAKQALGLPMFVKPANAGSSVGVHKVTSEEEFAHAIRDAFQYDTKLLIEKAIQGIEVECAILGNDKPRASVIGAIKPTEQFYSFEAKYVSTTGAKLEIPANITSSLSKKIQKLAIRAFQCIEAEGLSRVDFFLTPQNEIILNEINTMPGFTSISMYPKLWEASGLSYPDLLDELIRLALQRQKSRNKLKTNW